MSALSNSRSNLLHRDPARTALFSSSSRSNSPLPLYNQNPSQRYAQDRAAEDIEGQNDEALGQLSQKVKLLKNITINIGNEVRDSTKMLNGMNDTFGETGDFLSGTMKKMKRMAKKQGGQWCLWIAFLFIVTCVFFWTWVWRR
ncbi:SNARE domain- containing protein [Sporobolomyces koalae]|uniref:SNARE domain- containing protein n=1 Tax=Sporobolomyces koalae TaxID=500713 RepID=UPI0031810C82